MVISDAWRYLRWLLGVGGGIGIFWGATESNAQPLPPPPEAEARGATTLWLELIVNQRVGGYIAPVTQRNGHFYLSSASLRAVSIPCAEASEIAIDTLSQVKTDYDEARQRLYIEVPPNWLPMQLLATDAPPPRQPPRISPGGLISYDIYGQHSPHQRSTSLWYEARLFNEYGTFSSTGVYRHTQAAQALALNEGFMRYDTLWRYDDDEHMLRYEIGDVITRTLAWNTPIRMGGVQLSRNFSLRPDIITYPLPQFAGSAAVPTSVDLFIDGHRRGHHQVESGPFVIRDMPFINGAGEATLVTTDALGREITTTLPFYVADTLLRQGLSDYALAIGGIRRHYGEQSVAYGQGALSASYRYGLTHALTLQGHLEGADALALSGAGLRFKLGNRGVVEATFSASHTAQGAGQQQSLSYYYAHPRFSLATHYTQRTSPFADLSQLDTAHSSFSRRSTQITASAPIGNGSLGSGYFDIESFDGQHNRLLNLSWSQPFLGQSTWYLSANRALESQRWTTLAQLILPLGQGGGSASMSLQNDANGQQTERLDYTRAVPAAGGLGWTYSQQHRDHRGQEQQATATWRLRPLQLNAGTAIGQGTSRQWGELSGTMVWLDDALFASSQVNDAFVLIDTEGQPNVGVRYENQYIGTTDERGYLLIPNATAYSPGRYSIELLNLAEDMTTPHVEQHVAVKAGGGYILRFALHRSKAASATLIDEHGNLLPVGAVVHVGFDHDAYVGWDGAVYFEALQEDNRFAVSLPDGRQCQTAFHLVDTPGQIAQLGRLTCRDPSR